MDKKLFVDIFCNAIIEIHILNIECIRTIFRHYDFDFDSEKPDENGNILCYNCENCFNCVMCENVKNCKNCWFNWEFDNVENKFLNTEPIEYIRDEPLTKQDIKHVEECIEYIDLEIPIFQHWF